MFNNMWCCVLVLCGNQNLCAAEQIAFSYISFSKYILMLKNYYKPKLMGQLYLTSPSIYFHDQILSSLFENLIYWNISSMWINFPQFRWLKSGSNYTRTACNRANCLWHTELVYIFNGYDKEDKIIEKRFIPQP